MMITLGRQQKETPTGRESYIPAASSELPRDRTACQVIIIITWQLVQGAGKGPLRGAGQRP